MTTRQQAVEVARTLLDTPFHHQGRLKGVGMDCAGIVDYVAREAFGFTGTIPANYGREPDSAEMKRILNEHLDPIPVAEATLADVLWFAFRGDPQHIGIVTDIGILHSYAQVGKCVEHGLDDTWRGRIRGAWRFRGIEP